MTGFQDFPGCRGQPRQLAESMVAAASVAIPPWESIGGGRAGCAVTAAAVPGFVYPIKSSHSLSVR